MATERTELQALAERIERVEAQNRRLRRSWWGLLVLCVATLLVVSRVVSQRRVTAEEFLLLDRAGKPWVLLGPTEFGPGLSLYDANGQMRAVLAVTGGGPVLDLFDANRKTGAALYVNEGVPGLVLLDADGKPRLRLEVAGGEPAIHLWDDRGKALFKAP